MPEASEGARAQRKAGGCAA
jgi:hypothetical protein